MKCKCNVITLCMSAFFVPVNMNACVYMLTCIYTWIIVVLVSMYIV